MAELTDQAREGREIAFDVHALSIHLLVDGAELAEESR